MRQNTKNSQNALFLHGLNLMPELGPARLVKLSSTFSEYEKIYGSKEEELIAAGFEQTLAKKILNHLKTINLEEEAEKLFNANVSLLTPEHNNYPKLLREIPKFPPLLYTKGHMNTEEELCIAVVGTRQLTNYGRAIIPDLIGPIVEKGITIVSGLAFGVDAEAHKQSISKQKRTIAVLGGGLDNSSIYPKHHQFLAQQILDSNGALISEYPLGTPNFKQNFVARNRIISGLSVATIVIECSLDSGSLITANHALEQNRQVFAVPGPIYAPMSKGPNNLIKMGAKPITLASDIFEELNLENLEQEKENATIFGDTPTETCILKLLSKEPVNINSIIKISGLSPSETTSALTFLEIKGKVKNLGGQQYILSR
ncbi:MAG: DNA-protecting protein DprA [Candidatus Doudnabacteria bacterium]|nr:DNA-protecting protein DprA [Candidatus Doudnabacteria bacterium]